jgi:uncharacterized membrane protein YGL010W
MRTAPPPPVFEEYARSHQNHTNKLCHYIGIPTILFTTVGLLDRLTVARVGSHSVSVALLVGIGAVLYDLRLSPRLTAPFAGFLLLSYFLAPPLPTSWLVFGFVLGWGLQFVGHLVYEKKSPAFFTNLEQLLVGPLWMLGNLEARRSGPREAPRSAPLER